MTYFGGLSSVGRDYIGELLADVVAEFNEESKAGEECREKVKRAFRQTLLPGHKRSKQLQAELDKCEEHGWEPLYTPYPNPTPEPRPSRCANV